MVLASKHDRQQSIKTPHSLNLADIHSVGIFRALYLGDLLCSIPAMRALRKALPQAEISLIGLPWSPWLIQRFPHYLNRFIEFPGFPGLPEQDPRIDVFPRFISRMQADPFDLLIQMHGSGNLVNSICALFAARQFAGYYRDGEFCPDLDLFYPYPDNGPEILRHLELMSFLGVESGDPSLEFPLYEQDQDDLRRALAGAELQNFRYVCIHAGARFLSRRWLPERFAAVADDLAQSGYDIVLTGSTDELAVTRAVSERMQAPCLNLAGRTSLGALGWLVAHARLVITNDTGMSHVADALKTPSVVVQLGSDASRWAPLSVQEHRRVAVDVACRPCEHQVCPIDFPCARQLEWQQVAETARDVLRANPIGHKTETMKCVDSATVRPDRLGHPVH